MEIQLNNSSLPIFYALDSETRVNILNLLAKQPRSVTDLADELHYSKAVISKHISILEKSGLIYQMNTISSDKRRKILKLRTDNITITLPEKIYPEYQKYSYDIPLGNYFDTNNITPTCGMATKTELIGKFDDPNIFFSQARFDAQLIWFTSGYIEYIIPNEVESTKIPELLEISLELSSEFPQSNNNWPSDVSFWINDIKIGTWTVPGNFSDVRGNLTPLWWNSDFSQYGLLKHLRILQTDSAVDGESISDVTLSDLNLETSPTIRLRIGIDPDSPNQGGLTIFGKAFGNYPQNINFTYYYSLRR